MKKTRQEYIRDLQTVQDKVAIMGETARQALHKAMKSLMESDRKLAGEVMKADDAIDDMRFCGQVYYSADEAIVAAEECADYYSDDDDVIIVTVNGNEFEDGKGNIIGEPVDIYAASNKDRKTTMLARRKSGYVNPEVDYYAM